MITLAAPDTNCSPSPKALRVTAVGDGAANAKGYSTQMRRRRPIAQAAAFMISAMANMR
jgi:hypothetical protein